MSLARQFEIADSESNGANANRKNVCILNGVAVVQCIKKGAAMLNLTCLDFAKVFFQAIGRMLQGYAEGREIFDRNISNFLKSQTRAKRGLNTELTKFNINDKTNIKMVPLRTLLSCTETK